MNNLSVLFDLSKVNFFKKPYNPNHFS